ncbi:MAG: ATP-binding protein [Flavobacterium sp.]|uniref:sensor histidine kinase n=1 Tax=Flavobacterium sp. TaxID=239 RepID=UPI00326374EB
MQCFVSIAFVFIVSILCFFSSKYIDYRITALILLMTVSLIAMFFDILPVLLTAILSGLILNFFFIQPLFTFHITNTEDILMFLMYLIIALVNAVLTFKIREAESKARDKEEKVKTIKLYDTLLNSLSHELRTPIATIIGAIDTLKENKNKLSQNNQTELLEEIDKASIRLNRQVENLLNMSRLETGMLNLKQDWCDINELIYTVIQKITAIKEKHIISFIPDEKLPLFKLDAGLIEEILQNLVTNAILYTPKNSIINIEASYELNNCVFLVSDNGNGFPENEIQFVFDKFYRLPNSKTGGSGLGLSIVKGFVEGHNGAIKLQNNINSGACFTITIPTETSYLNNLKNE